MIQPNLDDARDLARRRARMCVTVYGDALDWLRADHPDAPALEQIQHVRAALRRHGASADESADVIRRLTDIRSQRDGAPAGTAGIAIFLTPDSTAVFALPERPEPWVGVADRHLIAPLMPTVLDPVASLIVLALSPESSRAVRVRPGPAQVIDIPGMPTTLEDELALDLTGDRQALDRLRTSEDPKLRLEQYCRRVDAVLRPTLQESHALLVVAAAEPIASVFAAVCDYARVAPTGIVGNHDTTNPAELAELATSAAEEAADSARDAALERLNEFPERARVARGVDTVLELAKAGAVDTLFVDVAARHGVPAEAFDVAMELDLIDEAVRAALDTRATIVCVNHAKLPGGEPLAAILRYAPVSE